MLTVRQKQFADTFLAGSEPKDAYLAAGYHDKNPAVASRRLLSSPAVREYLAEHGAQDVERGVADATEVLRFLTDVMRGEAKGEKERLRAAELLGKRHGLFSEKMRTDLPSVIIVDDLGG